MDDSGGSLRWLMEAIARLPAREADEGLGAGTMAGRYRLIERIGRGGFGVVYRATDTELGRDVALKLLHADGKSAGAPVLLREAQAMARLQHPHIVTVYDVGTLADGQLFVAMELVDGASLRRWLEEQPRSTKEIVRVFVDAGTGLAAAHDAGVVHRDFKPDNVLVGRDGVARVADFGLASSPSPSTDVTASGGGTPRYMPLEQVAGVAADARMDQFSFAVALWEALTGSHPFGDGTLVERRAHMEKSALQPPLRPLPAAGCARRSPAPWPPIRRSAFSSLHQIWSPNCAAIRPPAAVAGWPLAPLCSPPSPPSPACGASSALAAWFAKAPTASSPASGTRPDARH